MAVIIINLKQEMKYIFLLIPFLYSLNTYAQSRFISIDSTKIWINTIGLEDRKTGQPIVVFESGLGTPMDNWDKVLEGVAEKALKEMSSEPLIFYLVKRDL